MDIKQDPNAIPNFGGGGRLGELGANQPEQAQSSVELDAEAEGEDRADATPAGPESAKKATPGAVPEDPSKTGAGAIDGLVGAP